MNVRVKPPADDIGVESDKSRWFLSRKNRSNGNAAARPERDRARGYSINIKQVVLAFSVEFVIIGLVLVSQFVYAAQFTDPSQYKTVQALLFPLAFAMVELARVPLAIAVRTQTSWNMKLAALLGVMCAVVVTSFSLSQIGHLTFNPRLEAVHEKQNVLIQIHSDKHTFTYQKNARQSVLEQATKSRDDAFKAQQNAVHELNAQPAQNCSIITVPPQGYGLPPSQRQSCKENPTLKTLKAELDAANRKLAEADAALKQTQVEVGKYDPHALDQKISKAEQELRDAIYQSPLHSYTAMLFKKDQRDVTDGEVKTLEWYLIFIPSIAAAMSSTLIAITAVRRIKSEPEPRAAIPDEAVSYLFGPLVASIRQEAKDAVTAAANGFAKTAPPECDPRPA
jgi:hypothetical protein